jgi:hypothetical protein
MKVISITSTHMAIINIFSDLDVSFRHKSNTFVGTMTEFVGLNKNSLISIE